MGLARRRLCRSLGRAAAGLIMATIIRQSLADRVFEHLVATLAARTLKIGSRINVRQITEELSVSRTTVNKALEGLTQAGWVQANDRGQPIVVAYPPRSRAAGDFRFDFANQTDSSYEALLERILRGDYEPGEIIKERPVAQELNVNPATVRRAAEWLRADGVLVRLPRRGWRVELLESQDIKDIYQIRLLLEPWVIRGTVYRISDEILNELEVECRRLIKASEKASVYDRRAADYHFHRQLCENCGSRVLAETLDPLIRKVLLITTVGFRFGRATQSFEEHRAIIQALRRRDETKAVHWMKAHLRTALKFNLDAWKY
jgi:DNA-binding GntR family transcriptional regulator